MIYDSSCVVFQEHLLYSSDFVPDNLEDAKLNSKDGDSAAYCSKKSYHADSFLRLCRASGRHGDPLLTCIVKTTETRKSMNDIPIMGFTRVFKI
jgi:hypothetical protein